jgi:hypothetical protein
MSQDHLQLYYLHGIKKRENAENFFFSDKLKINHTITSDFYATSRTKNAIANNISYLIYCCLNIAN